MNDNNKKENTGAHLNGAKKAVPIVLAALAVFIVVCFVTAGSGLLSALISSGLLGLFSIGAYTLPIMLVIHALCYAEDVEKNKLKSRALFSTLTVLFISCIEYAVYYWGNTPVFAPAQLFASEAGGGFVGGVIGFALASLFGSVGTIIVCGVVLAVFAVFFFAEKAGAIGKAAIKVSEIIKLLSARLKEKKKESDVKKKQLKEEMDQQQREAASQELIDDEFFKAKGASEVKINELGIDEGASTSGLSPLMERGNVVQEPAEEKAEEPVQEKKRRRSDRPLDLSYGIEEELPREKEEEEKHEEPKPDQKEPTFNNSFFGLDDSADNVFTKSFDPFDFATGEKVAARPSSKVSVEEELDDMALYEMRANHVPTEREKRMMELEKRKKEWMNRRPQQSTHVAPAPQPQPAAEAVVTHEPTTVQSESTVAVHSEPAVAVHNEPTPSDAHSFAPSYASAPSYAGSHPYSHSPAPHGDSTAPEKVNAYTSYSTTKTTYTQPIKTVEFTITKGSAPAAAAPEEGESYSVTFDKNSHSEDSTEDVAAIIAERIARSNPAYARSANEMKTYTTVISSDEDELFGPAKEKEEEKETKHTVGETVVEFIDQQHLNESEAIDEEATQTVSEILSGTDDDATVNISELIHDSEDHYSYEMPEDTRPYDMQTDTEECDVISHTEIEFSETDLLEPETVSLNEEPKAQPAEPIYPVTEDKAEETLQESDAEAVYRRAAGFASALMTEPARQSEVREFKPYTPPVSNIAYHDNAISEKESSTLKVERNMLSPIPSSEYCETVDEKVSNTSVPAEQQNAGEAAKASAQESVSVPSVCGVMEDTAIEDELVWTDGEDDADTEENGESENVLSFSDEEEDDADELTEDEIAIETKLYEEESSDAEEIPPEEQNPEVIKMRQMFPFLAPLDQQKAQTEQTEQTEQQESQAEDAKESVSEAPFDAPVLKKPTVPSAGLVPVEEKKKEEKKKQPDYSDYSFPPIDLLAKEESAYDENIQAEIQENADKLIETLASFNVTASIKGVDRGPRITRYEVVPAKGVKVSSILNLQDDIALNLAAGSIRMEAPIPGKSAVGIEIPNKKSTTVRLRNLLETEDFRSAKSKTAVCIGRDVAGQPVFGDIAKMPHLLIAGATGMGKSVCINSLLISILYKARPDEVKLIMIDPKQVEFTMYNGIPHLLVPVVSDPKQAAGSLMWAVEEMERRYNVFYPCCVRNIDAYNEKVAADRSIGEPMSKIIIVIDEFADLMLQVKDPVETLVMRIAQKARAAGIYLIIGTQRPSVNVITGVIKANIPSRISCKVMSNVDSKTVLDSAGAEKLLDRGDALYAPSGSPKPHRVQCAFVADSEVEAIMNHLRQFSDGSNYDSSVMEEIERAAQKCSKKGGGSSERDDDDGESGGEGYLNDRQFLDAVEVAVNTRKISTSLIQRKLSIGYGKAAKFIDIMEDMGIVGEANGQRPREVLLTPDEWREKLARASLD